MPRLEGGHGRVVTRGSAKSLGIRPSVALLSENVGAHRVVHFVRGRAAEPYH